MNNMKKILMFCLSFALLLMTVPIQVFAQEVDEEFLYVNSAYGSAVKLFDVPYGENEDELQIFSVINLP